MPLLPSDVPRADDKQWKLRNIKWQLVFWFQDYSSLLSALVFLCGFVHERMYGHPVVRSAMLYDASISQPHVKALTMESWQAALTPIALLLTTLTMMEFVVFRKVNSITNAVTAWLHFVLSSLSAWMTAVWVTSFFKNFAGRLRPDFFARCKPDVSRHWDGHLDFARFVEVTCTNPELEKVTHGRFSFPSQHSAWAMTCAWYCVMYWCWTGYARHGSIVQLGRFRQPSVRVRIVRELGGTAGFLLLFCQVFFVWYIGACRFRENRHNVSDIVAGWFMGFIIASLYAMRAIYVYGAIRGEIVNSERRLVRTGTLLSQRNFNSDSLLPEAGDASVDDSMHTPLLPAGDMQ